MPQFRDPEAAERAIGRLEALAGASLDGWLRGSLIGNPAPDLALTNLERWLKATAAPAVQVEAMRELPALGQLLLYLLGASQATADTLIQNPELASLALDPHEVGRRPTAEALQSEGRRLLASAGSYSHGLDRLRFLKQRTQLGIVLSDLAGGWTPEETWRALSDLADASVSLALELVWAEVTKGEELNGPPPMLVVGFGKLGGQELNYSSDIDLVFVQPDGQTEAEEKRVAKAATLLSRALGDRMGRGALYRVDLRLRPYGGAGALVPTMRSIESYYRSYAEPWEVQALLRSRALAGPAELAERWEAMRLQTCFRPALGERALEEILRMRSRIEERSDESDLKRGAGGIRDVEFLVQIRQLLLGFSHPELRSGTTPEVLRRLAEAGSLPDADSRALVEAYTFLRQLEHRVQLADDQQTHAVPTDPEARERLARLMRVGSWEELRGQWEGAREAVLGAVKRHLAPPPTQPSPRQRMHAEGGDALLHWIDALPEADAFYRSLVENEGSLARFQTVLRDAPALVPFFQGSTALTEQLVSGEIEEPGDPAARLKRLATDAPVAAVAAAYRDAWVASLTRFALDPVNDLALDLERLTDALVRHAARRLYVDFAVLGLGSYATRQMAPGSDADLLMLVADAARQPEAEGQATQLLAFLAQLRRHGAPFAVDTRLRPDGRKGLLVRSFEGLLAYDLEGMEMWERFVMGESRPILNGDRAWGLVLQLAYAQPLTPERLRELLAIKHRIETERVRPQHLRRHVKLGHGGLNDIEWLVRLHEMRYPTATKAGEAVTMPDRIRSLGRARLLNAFETDQLIEAHAHLWTVRVRLFLLGLTEDTVPENPDRLDRLAHSMGEASGNAFLHRHERLIDSVRIIFDEARERLRA